MTTLYSNIGIIGSGRVAQALLRACAPHTATPPQIWGRSPDAVAAAIDQAGTGMAVDDPAALVAACDVVVIAVSDDAIPAIVTMLAASTVAHHPLICHVSGRSGAAVLAPLHATGARIAAIHPAMTFTGQLAQEVARMVGAPFAVTAPDALALDAARTFVAQLGGVPVVVAEDQRPLYHAALCHAANHLVTLVSGAAEMLRAAGLDDPFAVLQPLAEAALTNTLASGFDALSGPILRGDAGTIAQHLVALQHRAPETLPAYRAMALATLNALEQQGIHHPTVRALLEAK